MDTPLNPKAKGRRSMMAYFADLTEDMVQKERTDVLNVSVKNIRALATPVKAALLLFCKSSSS